MKIEGVVSRAAIAALISSSLFAAAAAGADPTAPAAPSLGQPAQRVNTGVQNPPVPGTQPAPAPGAQPMPMPVPAPVPAGPLPGGEGKGPEAPATTGKHRPEPYYEDQTWLNLEILNWIMRPGPVPPLVTRGTELSRGAIGVEGTTVLLQQNAISTNLVGGRATYGHWFNAGQKTGFEASLYGTVTPQEEFREHATGLPGTPVIARPFFNTVTGQPDALIVAAPGLASGSVTTISGAHLEGGNLDLLKNLKLRGRRRTDLLVGPAYLHLNESLEINSQTEILPGNPLAGTRLLLHDRFETDDHFYGGEIGARQRWHIVHLTVDLLGKVGVGIMQRDADISGSTTLIGPGGAITRANGGFLAQPSNSGHFSSSAFGAVPQLELSAGYEFTRHLKAIAGYNFIYAANLFRAADTIDTRINPTQLGGGTPVGPAFPVFRGHASQFAAQGLSAGLQWAY